MEPVQEDPSSGSSVESWWWIRKCSRCLVQKSSLSVSGNGGQWSQPNGPHLSNSYPFLSTGASSTCTDKSVQSSHRLPCSVLRVSEVNYHLGSLTVSVAAVVVTLAVPRESYPCLVYVHRERKDPVS